MKVLAVLLAVLGVVLAPGVYAAKPSLRLFPERVEIDAFFRGAVLEVRGTAPAECQVVLKLEGERETAVFNRKGRRGPLWMTTGSVSFEGLPALYMVAASCALSDIGPEEILSAHGLGYESLQRRTAIQQSPPGDDLAIFHELLRVQEHKGFYAILPDAVDLTAEGASAGFSGRFWIPAAVHTGTYRVSLFCFRDGKVVADAGETLAIEQVGFSRVISEMAFKNGALYGILAIAIALGAGVSIGVLCDNRK